MNSDILVAVIGATALIGSNVLNYILTSRKETKKARKKAANAHDKQSVVIMKHVHTELVHVLRAEYSNLQNGNALDLHKIVANYVGLLRTFGFENICVCVIERDEHLQGNKSFKPVAYNDNYAATQRAAQNRIIKMLESIKAYKYFVSDLENVWRSNNDNNSAYEVKNSIFVGSIRGGKESTKHESDVLGLLYVESDGGSPNWCDEKDVFFHLAAAYTDALYILLKEKRLSAAKKVLSVT